MKPLRWYDQALIIIVASLVILFSIAFWGLSV
jgi:hypothetical protein